MAHQPRRRDCAALPSACCARHAHGAIPIGILVSIYFRSRRSASPEAIAAVLLFTGVALVASFGIRAQVLGWGCFAAFLLCLERRDRWAYAAVPIVVLWANVHASVILAPAYLLLRLSGQAATRRILTVARKRATCASWR